MRKSLLIPLIFILLLVASAVPAWAGELPLKTDINGYLVPGQEGWYADKYTRVDDNGWVWIDLKTARYFSEDEKAPENKIIGSHSLVLRGLIQDNSYKSNETIFVLENCGYEWVFREAARVYEGITYVAESEVYNVSGIPIETWQQDKKDGLGWGFDYYIPESKRAEFIPTPPTGQKTVGLWLNNRVAALYSLDKCEPWYLDGKPYANNGVTYIPLRGVFDHLGAKITWDSDRNMALIEANGKKINFKPGSDNVQIKDGRVYIPLRLAAESLGYEVNFKNVTHGTWVTVTTPQKT
ncbi:stalk domain-containing protein [Desulfoscipio geothermicus]|uniref:Copper amine oxidase N-terminal domain-containing protein n=1 Tax=Desulfoscipio geothermicus DSM 3669 TaxID=1121426 RepID=A0A1I6E2C9_9FIRM|nr:stalk domain-containing protein [Desulfoscipio geothermicus]SFR11732.1 Copper amine oxidase N-terminal domain-containing protein [Desulfoscipio geothermicus DSM 3669]